MDLNGDRCVVERVVWRCKHAEVNERSGLVGVGIGSSSGDGDGGDSVSAEAGSVSRQGVARALAVDMDELPTAAALIRSCRFGLKIDMRAVCSIAGSDVKHWGTELGIRPQIEKVNGLVEVPFTVEGA